MGQTLESINRRMNSVERFHIGHDLLSGKTSVLKDLENGFVPNLFVSPTTVVGSLYFISRLQFSQ